jgi:hypothetical protein
MSGIYPLSLLGMTMAVWLATSIYANRLLRRFCVRFPAVAQKEIPFAFDPWMRHPQKAMFFLRRRSAEVMGEDPALSRSRQQFIGLCIVSALLPLLGFATIAVVAFAEGHR